MIKFNFKYIKDLAAPGSWRRGYDYYKKKMVLESKLSDNEVTAKVKGSFQDSYEIKLKFSEDKVNAECSCPLEEEWCKHAVCVGLFSIKKHYFEKYLTETTGQEFDFEDENPPEVANPLGAYKFVLNTRPNPKFVGIQILDRNNEDKVISNIEPILRAVLAMQKELGAAFELNDIQKRELSLLQYIYQNANINKNVAWFNIPLSKIDNFMPMLSYAEEVSDSETKKRLLFSTIPWKLVLRVNVSLVGNVLLSLHWHRPFQNGKAPQKSSNENKKDSFEELKDMCSGTCNNSIGDNKPSLEHEDEFPLEEIFYFSKSAKWGKYKSRIFPLDTALSKLPHNLTKSTFTDIRDADGGKFVYEELPSLKKLMSVEVYDTLENLDLLHTEPKSVLTLEKAEDNKIKTSLEFEYDGTIVPYGKLAEKTPYVTVKKPDEKIIYWVKRNLELEEQAYKQLLQSRFAPMQTNNLIIEGDNAIDFYNYLLPNAPENWKITESSDLSEFKISESQLKFNASIDFCKNVDSFEIELFCTVGKKKIEYEQIFQYFQQGNKYFYLDKKGNIEIPSNKIQMINKSLSTVDAIKTDNDTYEVKTFRAGIVAELTEQEAVIKMSKKFKTFWDKICSFNSMEEIPLPEGINAEFRDYQKKGFNWLWFLYSYGLNGILADDMGLGKTLQSLTLLQKAKEVDGSAPSLVICPTSVVFNWEEEVEKFAPGLKTLNLTGSARKDFFNKINNYDIIITSYALLRRDIDELKNINFRSVILDESQNIKNYESMTAQSAKLLKTTHKLALSGTPIENRLSELWSAFDFLMPGFLYDINEFNYRYAVPIQEKGDRTVETRLKKQVFPFILRRMKRDMAKDLPAKIENIAYCKMTPEQKDFYLDVLDSTKQEIYDMINADGFEKSKMSVFSALLRLRQVCCHPRLYDKEGKTGVNESGKFEHLKEMLEEIISEGHRILLFSQFVQMLDIVKDWFDKTGIKYEYLTGSTKDRQTVVNNFNNNENIPVFLISLKAGGTGLNLTGADYVIHYDPWWNPAVEDQATDRAYRIGQTKNVFVYRLITKGSVEEKIMKLKEKKRNLFDSVISTDRSIGKSITFEDIKDILTPDL